MPALLVDTENFVLLHIPDGKHYINAPNQLHPHLPQKGETCWYYILNFLRPRYGKAIDELQCHESSDTESEQSAALKKLKQERDFEKQISNYRKKETYAGILKRYAEIYSDLLKQKNILADKAWVQNRLNTISHEENTFSIQALLADKITIETQSTNSDILFLYQSIQTYNEKKLELEILTAFIQQEKHKAFSSAFISENYAQSLAQHSKETLNALRLSAPPRLFDDSNKTAALIQEDMYYRTIIIDAIIKHYQLPLSPWNPSDGIESLIKNLRQYGPHAVGGKLGISHHQGEAESLGTFHSQQLYALADVDYKQIEMPHVVLVVGAEHDDNNHKEYVYLIDTSLKAGSLMKISYELFCRGLLDIVGQSYHPDTSFPAPYAVCPNANGIRQAETLYQKISGTNLGLFSSNISSSIASGGHAVLRPPYVKK